MMSAAAAPSSLLMLLLVGQPLQQLSVAEKAKRKRQGEHTAVSRRWRPVRSLLLLLLLLLPPLKLPREEVAGIGG